MGDHQQGHHEKQCHRQREQRRPGEIGALGPERDGAIAPGPQGDGQDQRPADRGEEYAQCPQPKQREQGQRDQASTALARRPGVGVVALVRTGLPDRLVELGRAGGRLSRGGCVCFGHVSRRITPGARQLPVSPMLTKIAPGNLRDGFVPVRYCAPAQRDCLVSGVSLCPRHSTCPSEMMPRCLILWKRKPRQRRQALHQPGLTVQRQRAVPGIRLRWYAGICRARLSMQCPWCVPLRIAAMEGLVRMPRGSRFVRRNKFMIPRVSGRSLSRWYAAS